jgi:hypothetical protein
MSPTITTLPCEIRQKILGYAFQNAIRSDLVLYHNQIHQGHASTLLTLLTIAAKAFQNAPIKSIKYNKKEHSTRVFELVTAISTMAPSLAEDCQFIIEKVLEYGENWLCVVTERRGVLDKAYTASFALGRRRGEEERAAIRNRDFIKLPEFTFDSQG